MSLGKCVRYSFATILISGDLVVSRSSYYLQEAVQIQN